MSSTSERLSRLSPQKLALLKQAMSDSANVAEPIAVVGMGCRFAGASNIDDYWRLIRDAVDMTGEIPASRWDVDALYDPTGNTPGKMTTRWGGFLEKIDCFDAAFFGISPREAEKMDPQHRLLLEVVWEALEYGGLAPARLRESSTGVFVGVGGVDYSRIPVQLDNYLEQISAYSGTGNALSIAANRISYTLDLRGPSIAIDTACSSSLVAAHLAIRSLRANECDTAIVGGVNAILTPETTLAFSQAQMLSPDGKCRPFDHRANGYVRGEGCGAIILKRLSDAVSAGDIVLATIRGSAVNQDGMTSGITAPRGTAQVAVIRQALKDARRAPDDVSYIEAHGTATPLGDPLELQALADVFGRDTKDATDCYIGSVKANIGHTETSAGIASLIKVILMLRHRTIPKQTHFEALNPHVDLASSRLRVAHELTTWDAAAKAATAGVSSFGFGGTNAHLVLESATTDPIETSQSDRPAHVFAISAKTAEALRRLASRYSESIADQDEFPLADACHTAAIDRNHFNHRLAISTGDAGELKDALDAFAAGGESIHVKRGKARGDHRLGIAFLFAGQGSQYPGMGRQLYDSHPVFREALESCDQILADLLPRRLLEVLFEDRSDAPLVHETQYTQPALFAIEYALSSLWRSFGVEPTVMIGHSVGDYVAACEAGVFSLADGLKLISHRARLIQGLPRDGMMAAVFADREQVAEMILPYPDEVAIAADNGPQNVVISGKAEVVRDLLQQFELAGTKGRELEVSHAFHSPLLEPILDEFEQRASEVTFHDAKIELISSRDGKLIGDRIRDPAYWRDHLRNTVCFAEGVRTLQSLPLDAAIEIGPGTTLSSMSRRAWDGDPVSWMPSMRPGRDDWNVITESLSELYVRGARVDWRSFDQPWKRTRQVLPTYPFDQQSFWYDMSRRTTNHAVPRISTKGAHPLLGYRLGLAGEKRVYELTLDSSHPRFLADHCIDQSPVVPAAAYMEQAMAAAQSVFGDGNHTLRNLSIQQALVLSQGQRRVAQVQVGPEHRGECTFEVYSRPDDENAGDTWTLHASGTLHSGVGAEPAAESIDRDAIEDRMSDGIERESFYELMAQCGLQYGPRFQVLAELRTGRGESLCRLKFDDALQKELADYSLHPAILDGCLQSIAGVVCDPKSEAIPDLLLPTHAEQVRVYRAEFSGTLWIHTRLTSSQSETGTFETDIQLFDDDGEIVAEILSARVQRVSKKRQPRSADGTDLLYELRWHQTPIVADETVGDRPKRHWIMFADSSGLAVELARQLTDLGDNVSVVYQGSAFKVIEAEDEHDWNTYQLNPLQLADYDRLLQSTADSPPQEVTVIDFWGVGSADEQGALGITICGQAMSMLQAVANSTTVKVTRTVMLTQGGLRVAEGDLVSPAQSSLWGLGRTAMLEMPQLSCRLIDLDPAEELQSSAAALMDEFTIEGSEDQIAYRQGDRFAARLEAVPDRFAENGSDTGQMIPKSDCFSLRLGASGSLQGLHYVPIDRKTLGPEEVEIEVRSTGLNFSDVLKALGLYPGVKDEIVPLGIECAGVVTRVGEAAHRFQPGQRVMGVAPYSFASHTTTAQYALVATPDNVSDDQAATIPIAFLTAHYALCRLARLGAGERVLIHAGAGGVGQAAIQIAQAVGAEVFATAGSDEKRDFLRSLGVKHVMDSRSLAFADEILEITSGEGIDVVLNSLPGDAITKSLSILSAYGRFLEIGKTDIYQDRRIGLWPFQDNLSYFAIDLDRILRQRPEEIRQLYSELMPYFEQGTYRPLPLTSFAPGAVVDAFRYMAQRKNIGKVVVSFSEQELKTARGSDSASSFHTEGTVLITGGLGALGRQVANWAGKQGASHLAILSRGKPGEDHQSWLSQLQTSGVSLAVIQGDVSDHESLANALSSIPSSFPPVRGVIHAAGVLQDGVIQAMDLEQLNLVMAPKTQGAWNLHQVLTGPLDFFVLFSSVAGTMGSPGQANYAAGNAFLDGLASLRHHLGQPATSIAWGPWDEAGMAADQEVRRQLGDRGMSPLAPEKAVRILDRAIRAESTNLAVMDVQWETLLAKLPGRGSSALTAFRSDDVPSKSQSSHAGRNELLFKRLQAASPEQRFKELERFIAGALSDVMGVDSGSIETDQPLASLGLDSLMGMELRSYLESSLGVEIPAASLLDDPTVISLARVASDLVEGASEDAAPDSDIVVSSNAVTAPDPKRKSALVALGGSHGDDTPIFCLHPVGGDLRCYDSFSRALEGRPVYGLRARGLHAGSKAHQTMDEMMGEYAGTIRDAQNDGPYCLMGWSTGGIFAYEIARRFYQDQLPVQLIMVDTPLPAVFKNVDLNDKAKFLYDLVEFANYFAGTSMDISYRVLRRQQEDEALDSVLRLAVEHGVLPARTTPEYLQRLINVCKQHIQMLQGYQPPPCEFPVDLLRPEDTGRLSEATGQSHADDLGWGDLVQLRSHEVPGHHFTMMTGDNVASLVEKVEGLFRDTALVTRTSDEL